MNTPPLRGTVETYATEAAWLAARQGRVSATMVARILGLSAYGGPWDVWEDAQGQAPRQIENADQRRGKVLESAVLRLYAAETGHHVCDPRAIWGGERVLLVGPEGWEIQTPDAMAFTGEWGQVEGKTDAVGTGWGAAQVLPCWAEGSEDVVRPDYAVQCYWQMEVSGLPWVDLTVLLPRFELRTFRLCADADVQAALRDQIGEWRERHLVQGHPPALQPTGAARRYLARRFPGGEGLRPATAQESALVARLAYARAAKQWAEEQEAMTETALLALAGDADALQTPAGRVKITRYAEQHVQEYTVAAHTKAARATVRTTELEKAWAQPAQPVLPAKE